MDRERECCVHTSVCTEGSPVTSFAWLDAPARAAWDRVLLPMFHSVRLLSDSLTCMQFGQIGVEVCDRGWRVVARHGVRGKG